MTSSRPYLLRAFFEWITDNNLTPYLVVNTTFDYVQVPEAYIKDNRIVLNISPNAVQKLLMPNSHIEFSARFGGVSQQVYVPIRAVHAIYAKENGRGMVFQEDEDEYDDGDSPSKKSEKSDKSDTDKNSKGRPNHLTIVK